MCKCNPNIRTPFCGRGDCVWPKPEGTRSEKAMTSDDFKKKYFEKVNFNNSIGLDCGDNSCLYAPKKTGMRTNGGCRCAYNNTTLTQLYWRQRDSKQVRFIKDLFPYIKEMREALEKYKQLNGLTGPADQALKSLDDFVGGKNESL